MPTSNRWTYEMNAIPGGNPTGYGPGRHYNKGENPSGPDVEETLDADTFNYHELATNEMQTKIEELQDELDLYDVSGNLNPGSRLDYIDTELSITSASGVDLMSRVDTLYNIINIIMAYNDADPSGAWLLTALPSGA